jgi:hypothetical protein
LGHGLATGHFTGDCGFDGWRICMAPAASSQAKVWTRLALWLFESAEIFTAKLDFISCPERGKTDGCCADELGGILKS